VNPFLYLCINKLKDKIVMKRKKIYKVFRLENGNGDGFNMGLYYGFNQKHAIDNMLKTNEITDDKNYYFAVPQKYTELFKGVNCAAEARAINKAIVLNELSL
jgi:hypothetical protein